MDALKSEQKFTDSTHVVKFVASYMIQGITLRIQDNKKAKMIKQVNFYYNNKPVTDVSELKNKWSAWKKAKSCILSTGNEIVIYVFIFTKDNLNSMLNLQFQSQLATF